MVGCRFNQQGTSPGGLNCNHKTNRSRPQLPDPKVYGESLTGFTQVFSPDGLNNTSLSQSHVLEKGSCHSNGGKNAFCRQGRGGGSGISSCLDLVCESTSSHVFLMTSSGKGVTSENAACPHTHTHKEQELLTEHLLLINYIGTHKLPKLILR